jgi:transposase-like protein
LGRETAECRAHPSAPGRSPLPKCATPARGDATRLYTTNAIESLNSQVRRSVRSKGHFSNDHAVVYYRLLERLNRQIRPHDAAILRT